MSLFEEFHGPHRAEIAPGFVVGRSLPYRGGRGVGPFVFFDQMGPHLFPVGGGSDVAPHPHIGLSTLTYLFEGEIEHRDTLGSVQVIRPGDVNWMTAGRGVAHSERTPPAIRKSPHRLHGIQAWVALPVSDEEVAPSFQHIDRSEIPVVETADARHVVVAGEAFGKRSPVRAYSRLFYLHSQFRAGARFAFPTANQESGIYLIDGTVEFEGIEYSAPGLLHFKPAPEISFTAKTETNGMFLGGDPLTVHRRIWWNFVSSRPERIEEAKRQWREQKFGSVPGETEFIPLPG